MSAVLAGISAFFVGVKLRLWIEYALVAAVIVASTLGASNYFSRKTVETKLEKTAEKLQTVNHNLTLAETVNKAQDVTIEGLKELRSKDARVIDDLLEDFKRLARTDGNVKRRLTELENTNADVKDYLHQPIPAELACLLNNSCKSVSRPADHSADEGRKSEAALDADAAMR